MVEVKKKSGLRDNTFLFKKIVLYKNVFKYFCDLIAKIFFCYFYIGDDKAMTHQVIINT